jgi:hypothetical protein
LRTTTIDLSKHGDDKRSSRAGEPNALWWLHPRFPIIFFGVTFLIGALAVPENTYFTLYRSAKHVDLDFVIVAAIIYAGFLVGTLFAISTGRNSQERDMLLYCRWVLWPLFGLTVFGYATWLFNAVSLAGGVEGLLQPIRAFLSHEQGSSEQLKFEVFSHLSGITTCTQFGILYATVEALLWTRKATPRRPAVVRIAVVASFTLLRAMFLSERGAFFEVAVPVVVILFSSGHSKTGFRRFFARLAPLCLFPGLFAIFAVAEYFRSWSFYKVVYAGDYLRFIIDRFLGYYITSVNNAAVYYHYVPLRPLRYTLEDFIEFPVLGTYVAKGYAAVFGDSYTAPLNTVPYGDEATKLLYEPLSKYANYEFNTVAVVGFLVNEYSVFLAPVVALVLGIIATSLYKSFARGRLIGSLLYPSWFTGLIEISRFEHWTNQRYFPVLAFLLLSVPLYKIVTARASGKTGGRHQAPMRGSGSAPYSAGRR